MKVTPDNGIMKHLHGRGSGEEFNALMTRNLKGRGLGRTGRGVDREERTGRSPEDTNDCERGPYVGARRAGGDAGVRIRGDKTGADRTCIARWARTKQEIGRSTGAGGT